LRRVAAVARATAGGAVRGACLPRAVRRAGHCRARTNLAGHVARLALTAAGGIAADAVDALAARALVRAAARGAVRLVRRADAAAEAAVRSARLARAARCADDVRARTGRAGDVASLALPVARRVAAHAIDALATHALVGAAAGDAGPVLRGADAGGAVVSGDAVVVDHAIAGARGPATRIGRARDGLLVAARAGPVTGRS